MLASRVMPKFLVREQCFESPKDEGTCGLRFDVPRTAQQKGHKEKNHGKDESRSRSLSAILRRFGHVARTCSKVDR